MIESPDLFHIDYGRLFETLITIIVFSFFIERALAVIFESKLFIDWAERPKKKGIREMISAAVSVGCCFLFNFDAITIILQSGDKMTPWGIVLTGLIIAGGSKASIKLFHDVFKTMSGAEAERKELKKSGVAPSQLTPQSHETL